MEKLKNLLFSTRLTGILFILFAAAMGIATFIENDYGTQASKALVYNVWWFELIMIVFVINFTGNIFRYRLYRKEKWSVLTFHLAFILILIGAGITRYISYEGMMPIKEGEATDKMLSERTYFAVTIDNNEVQKSIERTYLFAPKIENEARFIPLVSKFFNTIRGGNDFSIETDFKGKNVAINYVNYIPNAVEEFQEAEDGEVFLHFVESGGGTRHDHYIKKGTVENVHNVLVAFDKETEGAVNIITRNDSLFLKSPKAGNFMVMATQQQGTVKKDTLQPFNLRSLYSIENMQFVVPSPPQKGKNIIVSSENKDANPDDLLEVEVAVDGEKKNIKLFGFKYNINPTEIFTLNGLNFHLSYGAKQLTLPFSVKLRDFQLERYPGSNSPKSFASEVTVIDKDKTFDFRIFMNNILNHRGYKFFQSSYNDKGEVEETHLSVNHDALGTTLTYIGYVLLFFAMTFILFLKGTRFADLNKILEKIKKKKDALTIVTLLISLSGFAQHDHTTVTEARFDSILQATKVPEEHAEKFSRLVIQDEGGRMKPVHTFASELLRKVHKSDSYNGLSASQVLVSMATNPRIWFNAPIIYLHKDNTKAREQIGVSTEKEYLSLSDLLTTRGEYKLAPDLEKAYKKRKKNKYEETIIAMHERAGLLYGVVFGDIFKFFPLQNDANNKWFSYVERNQYFKGKDSMNASYLLPVYSDEVFKAIKTKDYAKATTYLNMISDYQKKFGSEVMPTDRKIDLEIFYNKYDIFRSIYRYYTLVGVLMIILIIFQIFYYKSKVVTKLIKFTTILAILLFVYHAVGLGVRWYISGHAPWTNAYESMIYVAWATMFFGLSFGRKSTLTIGATSFVVGVVLYFTHKSWMDPAIGNLVPVLDSYWALIHVPIIVGSYAPLILCMILALIALILFLLTNSKNKKRIDLQIKEITVINEMSMTVGLVMLTIGNFLGGMWANESWGRYWGWDPKETWALINIMIYAFILHMRLIPGLRGRFTFNVWAYFAFAGILMGYLGVNHLLSGLHSYAAGESAPIPMEIWSWLAFGILLSLLSYFKYRKFYKK